MAIWDIFKKDEHGNDVPNTDNAAFEVDTDTTGLFDFAEEEAPAPLTEEERLKQRIEEQNRLIEDFAERMYDGRYDCYVLVDRRTDPATLEDATRPFLLQITPLAKQDPRPVVHVAVDVLSARHMARANNCVVDGVPLVKKVPFSVFSSALNNMMRLGIFTVMIHEGEEATFADSAHINSFVLEQLQEQNGEAYRHYTQLMRSVARTRAAKGSYYLIAGEVPDHPGNYSPTMFGDENQKGVHLPIFAEKALAQQVLDNLIKNGDTHNSRIMTVSPVDLVNLMTALGLVTNHKAYPCELIEPFGRHPMLSDFFIEELVLAYRMKKKQVAKGAPKAEEAPQAADGSEDRPIPLS